MAKKNTGQVEIVSQDGHKGGSQGAPGWEFVPRKAEDPARAEAARRALFDLLRAGGYDSAEVRYESNDVDVWIDRLDLYKGDKRVGRGHSTKELVAAVEAYLDAYDPGLWSDGAGSYGFATVDVAGRSVHFEHTELHAQHSLLADEGR
jgi:hypothetical protein